MLAVARFPDHFLEEIRERVSVSEVVGRHVKLMKAGRELRGLSPFNKEKTPSFYVNDAKMMWFDFSSGQNGSVFDFVMRVEGLTFPQAVEKLANIAGLRLPEGSGVRQRSEEEQRRWEDEQARLEAEAVERRRQRDAEQEMDEAQRVRLAGELWRETGPLAGTHGEAYFHARGIPTPPDGWPECVCFHGRLLHPSGQRLPAVVARVDDCVGELSAIWRIFLDAKKPVKTSAGDAKLGLGNASGGAVRIGGVKDHIGATEGVETAFGAWFLIRRRHPVWATLSTSGMMNFEPPVEVTRCDQFPDGDYPKRDHDGNLKDDPTPAGRKAARALRARLDAIGIAGVINPEPPPGNDYLDIWNDRKKYVEEA